MATVNATVDIEATPAEILDVLADLEHYPSWSSVHRRARIQDVDPHGRPKRATMTVAAAGLSDEQVLDYDWRADGLSWTLVSSGQQKNQHGSYVITKDGRHGSHVRYELTIDPIVPMPGIIVRRVMSRAVTAATDGLKTRVESGR
ncbi:MAG TPA: SRPBCC family protein [Jatrophihabitans sp.]|jgi:ribosome-associated toxin RatA of RatAB toxin-antitoxin module|uniref:SRPBCC family protein n=1 Tax=Jatrophihabitans sp. TaxID=1932789 RepID=UPI002E004AE4|nr:SRPBCC family protein [Jatrophihabitans sp.]